MERKLEPRPMLWHHWVEGETLHKGKKRISPEGWVMEDQNDVTRKVQSMNGHQENSSGQDGEYWLLFPRTRVQFPATTRQLTTVCSSLSGDLHPWSPGTRNKLLYVVHKHTVGKTPTQMHKLLKVTFSFNGFAVCWKRSSRAVSLAPGRPHGLLMPGNNYMETVFF